MKRIKLLSLTTLAATVLLARTAPAQSMSTPPATPAELEAVYTQSINDRTQNILKALNLTDAAKSNQLQDIIVHQYRLLRARDMVIDATLTAEGKEVNYANRASYIQSETKPLHDYFLSQLAGLLTPQQVDAVKDKMTYNKVEVTYNAYCEIIPGLNEPAKTKIMELLKAARDAAIDGGSANEKSAIFQQYKDQINDYLNHQGYDVAQAYKDWEAKQKTAKKSTATQTN
jgi:hypothetical protein